MKKTINIFGWIGACFFAFLRIYAISQGSFLGMVLFALAVALCAPLEPLQKLKKQLKINTGLSVLLVVVLLFAGVFATPTSNVDSSSTDETISSEILKDDDSKKDVTNSETDECDTTISSDTTTTLDTITVVLETSVTPETSTVPPETTHIPETSQTPDTTTSSEESVTPSSNPTPLNIPPYSGTAYVVINNNIPYFNSSELTTFGYEKYSSLDNLGRCGVALASCGKEIMPTAGEERGSISSIKPTGWVQAKYSGISGGYLWNRCHLIGWQLSAENANRMNLITGTRYMNINGMLPFENMVADYINESGNHVAYRITPIFEGNNLVCSGVQMEAYSVEDNGDGICFNVYCYNVQPGISIDYATGNSYSISSSETQVSETQAVVPETQVPVSETSTTSQTSNAESSEMVWIPKTGSKYHSYPSCSNMKNPSQVTEEEAEAMGYEPCKRCH